MSLLDARSQTRGWRTHSPSAFTHLGQTRLIPAQGLGKVSQEWKGQGLATFQVPVASGLGRWPHGLPGIRQFCRIQS